MSIMSGQRIWVFVGILVILGGAAFVFFDPLDLDLLGLKQGTVVVKHVAVSPTAASAAKPGVAASAANPPVAAPSPTAAPVAPQRVVPPPASPPTPAPRAAVAPVQAKAPAAPAQAMAPAATPPDTAPAQALQPPLKLSKTIKAAKTPSQSGQTASKPTASKPANNKPERAKNLDLRHCLELETDAAIAKCAGE
jgi:hypothetical protein